MKKFYHLVLLGLLLNSNSIFSGETKISIVNGTTGNPGNFDEATLYTIEEKMVPVKKLGPQHNSFGIDSQLIEKPLLIQAKYRSVTYNLFLNSHSGKDVDKVLKVYEITTNLKDLRVRSLIQAVRNPESLHVYKVYLIENISSPPKAFSNSKSYPEVFIPENKTEVHGQISLGSGMNLPLDLEVSGSMGKIKRPFLPGLSEAQIFYMIPSKDGKFTFEEKRGSLDATAEDRVIFYKPPDMEFSAQPGIELQKLEKDIPDGLKAYRVPFPKSFSSGLSLVFSGGTPIKVADPVERERKIRNGKILTDGLISFLGIAGALAVVSILYLAISPQIQNRKNR